MASLTRNHRIAGVLGIAGALCRANGVFALPPLFFTRRPLLKLGTALGLSMLMAIVLVPISSQINHKLFRAEKTGVERSLQLFDMAGIAHFSGDNAVLPSQARGAEACYTPMFWDTLPRFGCAGSFKRLPKSLTAAWIHAIVTHPLAYARHRLAHFNRTIFFIVPPMQQCVDAPAFHDCDFTKRGYLVDFVSKNALLWPVTWLTVGLGLIAVKTNSVSRALTLSGLLFGFAYLVVGVATDFRYFFWTELAVQSALLFHIAQERRLAQWKTLGVIVTGVWILGYSARLALF